MVFYEELSLLFESEDQTFFVTFTQMASFLWRTKQLAIVINIHRQ